MTKSQKFKSDHPSLSNHYDIEGMINLILNNNGEQWSDDGSYAIIFDDGSCYNTYIMSNYFIDRTE